MRYISVVYILSLFLGEVSSRYCKCVITHLAFLKVPGENTKRKTSGNDALASKDVKDKDLISETLESKDTSKDKGSDIFLQIGLAAVPYFASQLLKKLDFKDNTIISLCRVIFCGYVVLLQLLFWYLQNSITKKNDESIILIDPKGFEALSSNQKKKSMTVLSYDSNELQVLRKGLLFELCILGVLHIIMKQNQPLMYFPIVGIVNKISNPLIKVHLFHQKAIGKLSRPFKSPLEDLFQSLKPLTTTTTTTTTTSMKDKSSDESSTSASTNISHENTSTQGVKLDSSGKNTSNLVIDTEDDVEDAVELDEDENVEDTTAGDSNISEKVEDENSIESDFEVDEEEVEVEDN